MQNGTRPIQTVGLTRATRRTTGHSPHIVGHRRKSDESRNLRSSLQSVRARLAQERGEDEPARYSFYDLLLGQQAGVRGKDVAPKDISPVSTVQSTDLSRKRPPTFGEAPVEYTTVEKASIASGVARKKAEPPQFWHGTVLPTVPEPPDSEACCQSGCAICVYDLYEEEMLDYAKQKEKLVHAFTLQGIPLPPNFTAVGEAKQSAQSPGRASLSAFEALERSLAKKK